MSVFKLAKIALRGLLPEALRFSIFFPNYLTSLVQRKTKMRIYAGPFKGLMYAGQSHASVLLPKLMGIYEKELDKVVRKLLRAPFDLVIDVGAAEGYYAVGFAKFHSHNPKIVAFESSEEGRSKLLEIATMNNVTERILILGECTPELLKRSLPGNNTLIICDIEGGEGSLLNPDTIPALRNSSILVELHKRKLPGVEDLLRSRFASTHVIEPIHQTDRSERDFPFWGPILPFCPKVYIQNCVSEFRQPWEDNMTWFWMQPKSDFHP